MLRVNLTSAIFEVLRVAHELHITLAALRAVKLDDDGPVDFGARFELPRNVEPGAREPLTLKLAAGFPIEDAFVAEVRNPHLLVLFERKIGDEGAMRDDDQLALFELGDEVDELAVLRDRNDFVDKGERAVQPLGFKIRDRERAEAFVVCAP